MIFPSLTTIKSKTDKEFFLEKVEIFIRLVECYALKNSFKINSSCIVEETTQYMLDLGVITTSTEIELLKKIIGTQMFLRLVDTINFVLAHKGIEPLLVNINNSKRKELQSRQSNKPTIVDLFCGAGGLSLGFIEAGFKVVLANDIQDVCCETYKYLSAVTGMSNS